MFEHRSVKMVINASAAATLLEQRPEKNSGSEWDSRERDMYKINFTSKCKP